VPGLTHFRQTMRPYQNQTVNYGGAMFEAAQANPPGPQRRQLFSLPTGTGKGSIELALLQGFQRRDIPALHLTTSLEVLRSNLTRCGWPEDEVAGMSADKLTKAARSINCWTYRGYYEALKRGEAITPRVFLIDEAHHWLEDNSMPGLIGTTNPYAVLLGFTATSYRGTPKGTKALRDYWGEPMQPLTIAEAIAGGWLQMPTFHVEALVDDDEFTVRAGEFVQKEVNASYTDRLEAMAALVGRFYVPSGRDRSPAECNTERLREFDRATMLVCPSTDLLGATADALTKAGIPSVRITQATSAKDRGAAFKACRERKAVLLSIAVVGEGVDLPWLRRIIDARPTKSVVAWVQLVGRITRPYDEPAEYISTNRNLERHAWALEGHVPRTVIAAGQADFGGPSKQGAARVLGFERLGKLKQIPMPLRWGGSASCYALYATREDGGKNEFVVVYLPDKVDAKVFKRDGPRSQWRPIPTLPDGDNYYTLKLWANAGAISTKMVAWYKRGARRVGFDPGAVADIDSRQFSIFAALATTGVKLK